MSAALAHAWERTWRDLGSAADPALFMQLLSAWSEPRRHYHTLQHLGECLAQLDAAREFAVQPGEVSVALWFHDAVYDPRRHDNEERSAEWARDTMRAAGVAVERAERVRALVIATRHHDAMPEAGDAQLIVDIDLAILGAPRERFDEYERQVRLEYAHVGDANWRAGRGRVLGGFLARPAIYATTFFRSRFEATARANLALALQRLG